MQLTPAEREWLELYVRRYGRRRPVRRFWIAMVVVSAAGTCYAASGIPAAAHAAEASAPELRAFMNQAEWQAHRLWLVTIALLSTTIWLALPLLQFLPTPGERPARRALYKLGVRIVGRPADDPAHPSGELTPAESRSLRRIVQDNSFFEPLLLWGLLPLIVAVTLFMSAVVIWLLMEIAGWADEGGVSLWESLALFALAHRGPQGPMEFEAAQGWFFVVVLVPGPLFFTWCIAYSLRSRLQTRVARKLARSIDESGGSDPGTAAGQAGSA